METLIVCRICLNANVPHLIPDTKLKEVYEKLTTVPVYLCDQFQDALKPSVICYNCRVRLHKAHRLMLQCLKAEDFLTQMLNQLLDDKDIVKQELIEIGETEVTPFVCSAVQHVHTEPLPDAKGRIRIIFEEDLEDVEAELKSGEDVSEPDNGQHETSHHSDVDNEQTRSDPEDDIPLNYIKEKTETDTDKQNIIIVQRKAPVEWKKGDLTIKESKLETQNNTNDANKSSDSSEFQHNKEYIMDTFIVIESKTNNKESDDKRNVDLIISNTTVTNADVIENSVQNVTSDYYHDKESDTDNIKQCNISQNNNRNCESSVKDSNPVSHPKNKIQFICDVCGKSCSCKSQLKRHIYIHMVERPYSCKMCSKKFTEQIKLKSHEYIHTGERPFSCNICDKAFTIVGNLKTHERIHTGERPYSCKICEKRFMRVGDLKKHERVHTDERPYSCKICEKRFTRVGDLRTHERIHTGEKPYSCKICEKRITTVSNLKSHERVHTGERPYSCKICDKRFTGSSSLKSHERVHTGEKPYGCKMCDKRFTGSSGLKSHERVHTGEKPYGCKMCDKRFKELYSLKSHEHRHTGERPYSCKVCDKRFLKMSHLKSHERIHTGERPYRCKTCDKRFKESGHLKSHERIHTGERPYSCKVCDKRFIEVSSLKSHERIHTGKRPYSCKTCEKRFRTVSNLRSHELIHTNFIVVKYARRDLRE